MISWWLLPAAVAISLGLTWLVRRYAIARRLLDIPNARSSHEQPTPRGGGMAIVVTFLGCLLLLWALDQLSLPLFLALAGSGGLVALVGFLDDHYQLAMRWRFLAHIVAAVWALYELRGMPALDIAGFELPAGTLANVLAVVYIVWLVNLYNFMDGIDGIASIEAITVCIGAIVLYSIVLPSGVQWVMPAALIAAVGGFLCWNFPPARIFMGDAGSGFLGVTLAVLSIQATAVAHDLFWAWAILLGVFVVDASVTLIRRIFAGGRIYLQAHRNHAYQHAARRFGAHRPVSLAVGAINLAWLLPLAMLVALGRLDGVLGLLIGYIPLVWLALYLKAGAD